MTSYCESIPVDIPSLLVALGIFVVVAGTLALTIYLVERRDLRRR